MAIKVKFFNIVSRLYELINDNAVDNYEKGYNDAVHEALHIVIEEAYKTKYEKKRKIQSEGPHKITEVCNFCENAVTLVWDTKHDGYEIYCPCCGKQMTLKDAYYREVTAKEQEDADNKKFQPKEGEDCIY